MKTKFECPVFISRRLNNHIWPYRSYISLDIFFYFFFFKMDINSCPYCKTHQVSRMYNFNPGITRNSRKGTPSVSLECDLVSWKGTTWFLEYVTRYPEKDTRFPDNVTSFPNYVSWFSAKSSILIFSLFWKPGHIFSGNLVPFSGNWVTFLANWVT